MALGSSLIGATLLAVTITLVILWPRRYRGQAPSVQVLVLGDVGHSPRMQYQALSIAQRTHVQLIGYYESDLIEELARHPRLTRVPLTPAPHVVRRLPFVVGGPLKVVWQVLNLLLVLTYGTRPARWLLVQNPPSIPTLAVASLVAAVRNTRLLIDWHNYGWSILAGTRGAAHPFVAVAKTYEAVFGRLGDANLAVTAAMAAQLRRPPYSLPSSVPLAVLHDRPAALFQPAETALRAVDRAQELARLLGEANLATFLAQPGARVLVSSTSWTPDEDFQLLLDALVQFCAHQGNKHHSRQQTPSPILAVITGKGPQRTQYEAKIKQLAAEGRLPRDAVVVRTAFLPMRDYARLLALADLGVCLHMSSSGVDLPMKVVDMFGAGLPVVAYSAYESFGELVREGENGRGFTTAAELAALLLRLLDGHEANGGQAELATLREGARRESKLRWADEWDRVVAPILGLAEPSAQENDP
ncbi:beta-mannosyltransferase [Niveomyces insectorum RCEF 264]|uniref:Chitobiosyldiphosphodolichol beta-mannosyltransferase n=1 Tax=Niveomyces insectorum RCEF 264 TaxID=1081102 RepID=A0A162JBF2_9HYPO|nr:beta-mannosyltransferase [Niveomyces insectorum RCEF 264]